MAYLSHHFLTADWGQTLLPNVDLTLVTWDPIARSLFKNRIAVKPKFNFFVIDRSDLEHLTYQQETTRTDTTY
jgi:hypothetical protein